MNESVDCYVNALEISVRNRFTEDSFGEMRNVLSDAYEKLLRSEDPVVKYRMDTFRYLAEDSQEPIETIICNNAFAKLISLKISLRYLHLVENK